ncbi:MAG: DsbA family protein [Peptoniphilaceae bacterium]
MDISIFSDVVCTWSYGEEKVLRVIDYIYDGKVNFTNIMGGLISDYHDILPMNMKDKDSDETANKILLSIWKAGSNIHKMPVTKEIPTLLSRENPSTNYLDRAFVAARTVDSKKANKFLRKLRLETIFYNKNTMDKNILSNIAKEVDINVEDFLFELENNSAQIFLEDRMSSFDRRFENFPNFMYTDENGKEFIIKGYKNKKELINFISKHSNLEKKDIVLKKEEVLKFIKKYEEVFKIELVELFEDETKIENILVELKNEGLITYEDLNNGLIKLL